MASVNYFSVQFINYVKNYKLIRYLVLPNVVFNLYFAFWLSIANEEKSSLHLFLVHIPLAITVIIIVGIECSALKIFT